MYHFHVAPSEPRLPPVIPSVEEEPEQIGDVADADVGAVEDELTTTVVLTQEEVPQVPSALSQYVVVLAGFTTGAAPEVVYVPPHELTYHFHVAPSEPKLPPVIPRVEEEPEQTGKAGDAEVGAED